MKLLIVTHNFPPLENPRAFRWGALAKYWADRGHDIDVIASPQCATNGNGKSPNLRVYGVGLSMGSTPALSKIEEDSSADAVRAVRQPAVPIKAVAGTVVGVMKAAWKSVCWPDYACAWYPSAIRRARMLASRSRYDAMITVSHPYTPHLVGHVLAKQHSELRWLVDIGDPFSTASASPLNNQWLYANRNKRLEGDVIRRADCISVTTAETKEEYCSAFPEAVAKTHVIPPLLSFPDNHGDMSSRKLSGPRKLIFAGTLHHPIRTPVGLLQIFRQLIADPDFSDLQLHFYGRTDECHQDFAPYADLIGRKIFLHGIRPRQLVWQEMQRAHILVNIGNSTSTQLPSKLVEYVSTGRPVLNLTTHKLDSSRQGLNEYPAALNINTEQMQDDESAIAALCEFVASPPQVRSHTIERLTAPFQVEIIAEQYEELLTGSAQSRRRAA